MVATSSQRRVVVFDIGGVLLDWDPRHLYRKLFAGDERAMEDFLTNVCTAEWNKRQDAGRTFAEAHAELLPRHWEKAHLIEAFGRRFDEMIAGPIEGTVDILADLKRAAVPRYALTNWSAETYLPARERFDFLSWFDGVVISGEERVIKPDPRIFHILLERYHIAPDEAVFIDDNPDNAAAATALGIHGIHFRSPEILRRELEALALL
ncbi:MAG: HAD family phosphatase [Burkholderiales bacterium]